MAAAEQQAARCQSRARPAPRGSAACRARSPPRCASRAGRGCRNRVEAQAGDDPERRRLGERRAVAVEIRQHVEVGGEVAILGPAAARRCGRRWPRWRVGRRLAAGAVPADQVIEQRAGRRLAGLEQPEAGQDGAVIGAPDARRSGRESGDSASDRIRGAGDEAEDWSIAAGRLARRPSTPSAPAWASMSAGGDAGSSW